MIAAKTTNGSVVKEADKTVDKKAEKLGKEGESKVKKVEIKKKKIKKEEKIKVKKTKWERKHGKKYREKKKLVGDKEYSLEEAIGLIGNTSPTSFVATCEVHITLNVDPKNASELTRGTVVLPYGTGKSVKVAAFVTEDRIKSAIQAGASIAGVEDLIKEVEKGKIDFDIAVAIPSCMKNLGKVAKILGQKGLMPNPKAGTISENIEQVIKELKKGRIEFRTDKLGIIHSIFGKVSHREEELLENIKVLIKAVTQSKPESVKGKYIKNITLATTMGPPIKLDLSQVLSSIGK